MILVTGATGNVGRELVQRLVELGTQPFSVLSRSPDNAAVPDGVRVHTGSLADPVGLDSAFEDVERVFFLGPEPLLAQQAKQLIEIAQRMRVRHVVFLSSLAVEMSGDSPLKYGHLAAEEVLTQADIGWTMLRAGVFDSNALQWAPAIREGNIFPCYLRNDPYAPVDPADIAAVAAEALASDKHIGEIYRLTGPEQITPEQQCAVLAELRGKPIQFVELDDAQAEEFFRQQIGPDAVPFLKSLRRTDLPWMDPRPDVEQVTGRPAQTFARWAQRHIDSFA